MPDLGGRAYAWLFADTERDRSLPFGDKEGYGIFSALATFALAQGAALTAVAKDEDHKWIVLLIYFVAVLATVLWIRWMLRATRKSATKTSRAYDEPSILYGRWAQGWTLFLAIVLFYLGALGLLPNQTARVFYDLGNAECVTDAINAQFTKGGPSQQAADQWLQWVATTNLKSDRGQMLWVEMKDAFPRSYKPFTLELRCDPHYQFMGRVAFLTRRDAGDYRPTYRQIPFIEEYSAATYKATLAVPDASRGEKIVILVMAGDPNSATQPPPQRFDFRLYAPFSGTPP